MAMSMVRVLMAAMALAAVMELAMAANYDVGDNNGWALGVDYTKWVANKKFLRGDNITFTYSSAHDVVEVNAADYAACSASDPINTFKGGKTIITMEDIGKKYFLCGTPNHCAQGMKVVIDVVPYEKSPAPTSSPAGGSSSPSGNPPSPSSLPAPSAATRSSYVQGYAAVSLGMLAAAAFGLVIV